MKEVFAVDKFVAHAGKIQAHSKVGMKELPELLPELSRRCFQLVKKTICDNSDVSEGKNDETGESLGRARYVFDRIQLCACLVLSPSSPDKEFFEMRKDVPTMIVDVGKRFIPAMYELWEDQTAGTCKTKWFLARLLLKMATKFIACYDIFYDHLNGLRTLPEQLDNRSAHEIINDEEPYAAPSQFTLGMNEEYERIEIAMIGGVIRKTKRSKLKYLRIPGNEHSFHPCNDFYRTLFNGDLPQIQGPWNCVQGVKGDPDERMPKYQYKGVITSRDLADMQRLGLLVAKFETGGARIYGSYAMIRKDYVRAHQEMCKKLELKLSTSYEQLTVHDPLEEKIKSPTQSLQYTEMKTK